MDIEASTTRNNRAKVVLRESMYRLVAEAFTESGIGEHHHDRFIDRGDGLLALIYPSDEVPKTLLLRSAIPALSRLLARHNARWPENPLRLRVVVHAGDVLYDRWAPFGEALDVAFRLLDGPGVKRVLFETTAPLVLVVSGEIYRSVVRQGYDGINQAAFLPLLPVRVADQWQFGWVHVPGQAPRVITGRAVRIPPAR